MVPRRRRDRPAPASSVAATEPAAVAKFQAPKGTRDFYPEQMALRNWIAELWRRVAIRNGFVEFDGPTFEYLDLYKLKSGGK
jgi:histidyl-tRNA synthetase